MVKWFPCLPFTPTVRVPIPKKGTFFKKMGQPWPLFRLFSVFSCKQYNFTTNQCKKCSSVHPVDSGEIQTYKPYKHESSPLTTRPGLPSKWTLFLHNNCLKRTKKIAGVAHMQCDQIWQNFATLAKVYKILVNFKQFIFYLAWCWAYFCKFVALLG